MSNIEALRGTRPIVVRLDKKKKKTRYSNKTLRRLQKTGRRFARIAERSARGSAKGATKFRRASIRSAEKKRDGAIKDLGSNLVKGLRASVKESSTVPIDIARAVFRADNRKSSRRRRRKISKRVSRALGIR